MYEVLILKGVEIPYLMYEVLILESVQVPSLMYEVLTLKGVEISSFLYIMHHNSEMFINRIVMIISY